MHLPFSGHHKAHCFLTYFLVKISSSGLWPPILFVYQHKHCAHITKDRSPSPPVPQPHPPPLLEIITQRAMKLSQPPAAAGKFGTDLTQPGSAMVS